jgi:hypothetical protein
VIGETGENSAVRNSMVYRTDRHGEEISDNEVGGYVLEKRNTCSFGEEA